MREIGKRKIHRKYYQGINILLAILRFDAYSICWLMKITTITSPCLTMLKLKESDLSFVGEFEGVDVVAEVLVTKSAVFPRSSQF